MEEPRKAVNGNASHEGPFFLPNLFTFSSLHIRQQLIFPAFPSERTPLKSALKRSTSQRSVRTLNPKPTGDEDEDPRFEIYIMGPQPSQAAQFKTRGRHPVRKVLQAACKAFGLDYDRYGLSSLTAYF